MEKLANSLPYQNNPFEEAQYMEHDGASKEDKEQFENWKQNILPKWSDAEVNLIRDPRFKDLPRDKRWEKAKGEIDTPISTDEKIQELRKQLKDTPEDKEFNKRIKQRRELPKKYRNIGSVAGGLVGGAVGASSANNLKQRLLRGGLGALAGGGAGGLAGKNIGKTRPPVKMTDKQKRHNEVKSKLENRERYLRRGYTGSN